MTPAPALSRSSARGLRVGDIIRPHWKSLALALVAVVGVTAADLLEPWPVKVVIDNILRAKALSGFSGRAVTAMFGRAPTARAVA